MVMAVCDKSLTQQLIFSFVVLVMCSFCHVNHTVSVMAEAIHTAVVPIRILIRTTEARLSQIRLILKISETFGKNQCQVKYTEPQKIPHHFSNAFNMVLTLNFCILKVTDATTFKFMMPIYH